ncbi:TIGR03576 family pyridoxal phosphate-dependent enzyme [Methanobrevibacter wolinii]|uniref:TIGR03576 family pyridoxal phosphate-dependent enzyme n=1 Tax=Methanobrevibacter wolinii TaxID=190977 RepID=UPI0005B26522|nr:TIGR03576 family pyridoxal phosphate-dependent enzyme [Methanobrevibacter wolinii]MDD5959387.1 TIGR03576 family pyridoxal phosphate-dependent enzyme [Methanobrevibacter wolinii]
MIVENSLDELKKREAAYKIIKDIIESKEDIPLYDLTGLSGGFLASEDELSLLQTYIGPAIFEDKIQEIGKKHMGGEKLVPLNRTSSGILATILSLVKKGDNVVHFLKAHPAHPSITRACDLVGANYEEFIDINKFNIPENTSLVIITGSTMDHQVLDEETFKKVIKMAHEKNIPVFVDDASGARLRTAIFNQKPACELGADLAITSTDKLMKGPRGGLLAGREDLVNMVKTKSNEFGLEAQAPIILAMINALKDYNPENLRAAISKKDELFNLLNDSFDMFETTPTGVRVSKESLYNAVKSKVDTKLSNTDLCFLWSMILLKNEKIITIPAVSMPGASTTIRFDLSANDANKLEIKDIFNKISNSFDLLIKVCVDVDKSRKIIYNE